MYSPFWALLREVHERRDHKNLLIITYEQMQKDLTQIIHKVAKFLGK